EGLPRGPCIDRSGATTANSSPLDGGTSEVFLPGATYDMLLSWAQVDPNSFAPGGSFHYSDVRLHYLEGQGVTDDTSFAVNSTQARHTITFDGKNENSQPLVGADYDGYASTGRIVFPSDSKLRSAVLDAYLSRTWHVTDITPKLLLEELNYSFIDGHFYILPYPALNGVHEDHTLTGGGSELKRVSASLALTPPVTTDQRVVLYIQPITPPGDVSGLLGLALHLTANYFNPTVFIGPDGDPDYSIAAQFQSITDAATRFTTPLLRILNGKL